jgi:hypothetical protein
LLRFYDTNQQVAATLRVPNPLHGPYPKWDPDPLPVSKTNGDLSVTFNGMKKTWQQYTPGASFEFKWKGLPTTEWRAAWGNMVDETGNWVGGQFPGLPESEKVWRLRQYFLRKQSASFGPEEHFFITNLAVPSPGTYTNLNIYTNLQGLNFGFVIWTGPSVLTISNGLVIDAAPPEKQNENWRQVWWRQEDPGGLVTAYNVPRPALFVAKTPCADLDIAYVFRDQNGRGLGHSEEDLWFMFQMVTASSSHKPTNMFDKYITCHGLALMPQVSGDTRSLTLEVIAQQPRMLDFYFEPPRTGKWGGH